MSDKTNGRWVGPTTREDQVQRIPKSLVRVAERIRLRRGYRSIYQALESVAIHLTKVEDGLDNRKKNPRKVR